jgi:hypothetical protein
MVNDEDNDDSEEMFPLDEDIAENYTFNNSKRRESKKYLDIKDEDEMEENRRDLGKRKSVEPYLDLVLMIHRSR